MVVYRLRVRNCEVLRANSGGCVTAVAARKSTLHLALFVVGER